jgi:hypothetical protein
MSKRQRIERDLRESIVRIIALIGLMIFAPIIGWWDSIPLGGRVFLLTLATIMVAAGVGSIVLLAIYRKRQRADAWHKAMANWSNPQHASAVIEKQSVRYMTDKELEIFAARVYSKMGYKVKHVGESGDHGIDVYMSNPKNQIEIVQCKQWKKPVGEPQVRDLYGAMGHEKAVRGWLWSPMGFSEPARKWASGKSIELVDDTKIGRLIEIGYTVKQK